MRLIAASLCPGDWFLCTEFIHFLCHTECGKHVPVVVILLALWHSLVLLMSLGKGPAPQLWKLPQTLRYSLDSEGPSIISTGPPRGGHVSATPGAVEGAADTGG